MITVIQVGLDMCMVAAVGDSKTPGRVGCPNRGCFHWLLPSYVICIDTQWSSIDASLFMPFLVASGV